MRYIDGTRIQTHARAHTHTYTHTSMRTLVSPVHQYVRAHTHTHTRARTNPHTYKHAHIRTHAHPRHIVKDSETEKKKRMKEAAEAKVRRVGCVMRLTHVWVGGLVRS